MNHQSIKTMRFLFLMTVLLFPTIGHSAIDEKKVAGAEYFAAFLRSAVEEQLTLKFSGAGREIEKMTVIVPKSYHAPAAFDDLVITVPYQNRSGRKVFVAVSVLNEGQVISRLNVMAEVVISMEMVVASRDISRDEIVQKEDVTLERRTTGPGFQTVAQKLDEVVGKQMGRSIRSGAELRVDQLKTPLMVSSGDMVTVVADNGRMRISTVAKARESGNVGQWIRIQNVESKKQFNAKITGPGLVTVHF